MTIEHILIDDSDGPDNPNCLHCHLNNTLIAWSKEHPDKPLSACVIEVAEVLAELAASDAVGCDSKEFSLQLGEVVAHFMRFSHQMRSDIIQKLAKDAEAKERSRAH